MLPLLNLRYAHLPLLLNPILSLTSLPFPFLFSPQHPPLGPASQRYLPPFLSPFLPSCILVFRSVYRSSHGLELPQTCPKLALKLAPNLPQTRLKLASNLPCIASHRINLAPILPHLVFHLLPCCLELFPPPPSFLS